MPTGSTRSQDRISTHAATARAFHIALDIANIRHLLATREAELQAVMRPLETASGCETIATFCSICGELSALVEVEEHVGAHFGFCADCARFLRGCGKPGSPLLRSRHASAYEPEGE